MADPTHRLVILDELNIALRYDYLDLARVVAALAARRPDLHVVVTGRNAKPELLAAADLVTEMGQAKHHFAAGVKAQAGHRVLSRAPTRPAAPRPAFLLPQILPPEDRRGTRRFPRRLRAPRVHAFGPRARRHTSRACVVHEVCIEQTRR